jgi:hypothetical protein
MNQQSSLILAFVILGGGLMVVSGCAPGTQGVAEPSQTVALIHPEQEFDGVWESAQNVLRRHHFVLDRVDRRQGVITTQPATSQHFFEFWRRDVATTRDFFEATLNPIRRWVEVHVPVPEGGDSPGEPKPLEVIVHRERLSCPDRQFNNTGAAFQFFADALPSTTGIERVTEEYDRWLDRGRDHAYEGYLQRAILDGMQVVLASHPAEADVATVQTKSRTDDASAGEGDSEAPADHVPAD